MIVLYALVFLVLAAPASVWARVHNLLVLAVVIPLAWLLAQYDRLRGRHAPQPKDKP